jgi:ribonuclease BN (tRNA processing enzyme)
LDVRISLEVLGFAGAAPLQGACPSYLVSDGSTRVLLDCGPGTIERLWRRGHLGQLDAIVVSHMHADHVLDLVLFAGELVQSMLEGRRPKLFVPQGHGQCVLARLDSAFAREPTSTTRFDRTFDVHGYEAHERLSVGALSFTFAPTDHAQPCFATRITDGRRAIVYGSDGGPSDALADLARGADLLILEATYLDDEQAASANRHMTAIQAGELADRARAARLLLTHTLAGTPEADLLRLAASSFAGPVELAREGYRYAAS